jgi:hypothetical protein
MLPRMAAEYGGKIICQVKLSQWLRNLYRPCAAGTVTLNDIQKKAKDWYARRALSSACAGRVCHARCP